MTNFIKRSISIGAAMGIIQEVLIQYRYIKEWEEGFDSLKELHVYAEQTTIVHWDIEQDIDYIFDLTEHNGNISVELKVGDLSKFASETNNWKNARNYVNTVLNRIKNLSESLQLDKHRQHTHQSGLASNNSITC